MTVNTVEPKITYQGNGSTTSWGFTFAHDGDPNKILVFITNPDGTLRVANPTEYIVALHSPVKPNPTPIGGAVQFPVSGPPLAVGYQITIYRVSTFTQDESIANQSIIYPPVIEQEFDSLAMADQELYEIVRRSVVVPVSDQPMPPLPTKMLRANKNAFFDVDGNLTAGEAAGGGDGSIISAAMVPVVSAATIKEAQIAFGLGASGYSAISGEKLEINGTYTITNLDKGKTILALGSFYAISLLAIANYDLQFQVLIINISSRGKKILIDGIPAFDLYPGQFILVTRHSTAWVTTIPGRWRTAAANFFVSPTGDDNNDGLSSANDGAFLTIQKAVDVVERVVDGPCTIQLANGTYLVGNGVITTIPTLGADGFQIVGNVANPAAVVVASANNQWCFLAIDNTVMHVSGVSVARDMPGNNSFGFGAVRGAVLVLSNIGVGDMGVGGHGILAQNNGTVHVTGPVTLYGGGSLYSFATASISSFIQLVPGNVTIGTALTLTGAFLNSSWNSLIIQQTVTYVNPSFITGKQYDVTGVSVLIASGITIPGTIAGTVSLGGIVT